jgi:hypothetical protein
VAGSGNMMSPSLMALSRHLSGSEIAAGLKELRLCRLVTIHEGIPTSSRDVSPELAKIDHVELLPSLMEDE